MASTSFAHKGNKGFFHLGHRNVSKAVSTLVKKGAGPALNLKVGSGPPMAVNSSEKVANLNADKIDTLDSTEIGINSYERIRVQSTFDSTTHKSLTARCTSGREVIGGGAQVFPSLADGSRDSAPIAIRANSPDLNGLESWRAQANEVEPYSFNWTLYATVICAKVGP